MLSILRRNAGSWAIKFILGFIALTFVWWGVGTYSEREREVAATVGDTRISMTELSESVSGLERSYRDVYGDAFTREMAAALDLRKQALDGLVQRALFLAEAEEMGIVARPAEVQREIAANPAFQVDGQFREDRYRSILSYNRVNPAAYEAAKRDEITLRKMEGLFAASSRVSEAEAREYFDLAFRRIRLLVVTSDPAARKEVPAPTEAEIAAHYEETRERYRIPARVRLSVARFSPDLFARTATPSEEEIRSFYEGNVQQFRTEETRLVSHLLLPYATATREAVRKKAEELLPEANRSRERFEELAKRHSRGKAGASWFKRGDMKPSLAEAAFAAGVDQVVGPVDIGEGFVLARVNQIRFPEPLPLAQVRDQVDALLRHERGKDLAVIRAYEAHGKATETQDLAGACAPYGIVPADSGWVSPGTQGNLPADVIQAALVLDPGQIGPVKTAGDSHYLFRVAEKEESRIPPLSAVRDRVKEAVLAASREAAARAALEKVLSGSGTASDLERNAARAGLPAAATDFFLPLSDALPGNLSGAVDLRNDLLGLGTAREVSPTLYRAGRLFLAVAFRGERLPTEKEWKARRDSFLPEIAEQKKTGLVAAFLAERRKSAKVEIHPQALQ